jgi:uncharacterized protein (DUF1697 family)
MPTAYVALLRGINVGGKNKLPMKELSALFVTAGCTDVRTYIQSGNVLFNASRAVSTKVAVHVAEQISERFGYRTPVVVRTTKQMEGVVRGNPFLAKGEAEDRQFVLFLADLPTAAAVAVLDPNRSPGDAYILRDRDIYMHLPNGVARTKLTNAYFDSKLSTISTGRNWRTVTKLLEMMQA